MDDEEQLKDILSELLGTLKSGSSNLAPIEDFFRQTNFSILLKLCETEPSFHDLCFDVQLIPLWDHLCGDATFWNNTIRPGFLPVGNLQPQPEYHSLDLIFGYYYYLFGKFDIENPREQNRNPERGYKLWIRGWEKYHSLHALGELSIAFYLDKKEIIDESVLFTYLNNELPAYYPVYSCLFLTLFYFSRKDFINSYLELSVARRLLENETICCPKSLSNAQLIFDELFQKHASEIRNIFQEKLTSRMTHENKKTISTDHFTTSVEKRTNDYLKIYQGKNALLRVETNDTEESSSAFGFSS